MHRHPDSSNKALRYFSTNNEGYLDSSMMALLSLGMKAKASLSSSMLAPQDLGRLDSPYFGCFERMQRARLRPILFSLKL